MRLGYPPLHVPQSLVSDKLPLFTFPLQPKASRGDANTLHAYFNGDRERRVGLGGCLGMRAFRPLAPDNTLGRGADSGEFTGVENVLEAWETTPECDFPGRGLVL